MRHDDMLPATRVLLYVASVLVTIAAVQLYVLTEATDTYFAWTIAVPLSAAFLGTGFFASLAYTLPAARDGSWPRHRALVIATVVFSVVTLVTTLLHLDKFNRDSDQLSAVVAFWAWLVVYVALPVVGGVLVALEERRGGWGGRPGMPLPPFTRLRIASTGAGTLLYGLALFAFPAQADWLWPWTLTALTARAIAAWLIAGGTALLLGAWQDDYDRLGALPRTFAAFAGLFLVTVVRYRNDLDWGDVITWLAVLSAADLLVSMLSLWRAQRRARAGRQPGSSPAASTEV